MKKNLFVLSLITVLLIFVTACSQVMSVEEPEIYTYDNFLEEFVQPFESNGTTKFMVEGDIVISNEDLLGNYYNSMMGDDSRSTVHLQSNGDWDLYSPTEARNLTYTVEGLPSNIVNIVHWACDEWEKYGDLDFTDVTGTSQNAVFTFRRSTTQEENQNPGVIASAFFPGDSVKELVLYDDFDDIDDFYGWDKSSVLLHELGHGIGLRHEFIWRKRKRRYRQYLETYAPAELITDWDTDSIMYYPQYSAYTGDGYISSLDMDGVGILYP